MDIGTNLLCKYLFNYTFQRRLVLTKCFINSFFNFVFQFDDAEIKTPGIALYTLSSLSYCYVVMHDLSSHDEYFIKLMRLLIHVCK